MDAEKRKASEKWVRSKADELALDAGYWFEPRRAAHVCEFFERFLILYEGSHAGEPFKLLPWHREVLESVFGWVGWSDHFNRPIRRFKTASVWVPKKNGKSPFIAGIGMYLLTSDGEAGQKVYSAARTKEQAGIMHKHAMKFVEKSPLLSECIRIHKTTKQMTYGDSMYALLSGDDPGSKEGLNGSIMIDEVHVVDDVLAGVLEYAGISRAEALRMEVSTAGSNALGYGKRQFDFGIDVERGAVPQHDFYFRAWTADGMTEDKLDDPAVWKKCNPGWGVTIDPKEFRASYQKARLKQSDWELFKMYRLNIWSTGESAWLPVHKWRQQSVDFSVADLAGAKCFGGLDLSKVRDLTAFSLVCDLNDEDNAEVRDRLADRLPNGGIITISQFWLPEAVAEERRLTAPFKQWASHGWLHLSQGDTIDTSIVRNGIREMCDGLNLQGVAFDPYMAEDVTQALCDGVVSRNGDVLEPGLGCKRVAFGQTITNFAPACAQYESLLHSGKLHGDCNPLKAWQIGNVKVKTDMNANKRPVKPKPGDFRTIDGVVADLMALGLMMQSPQTSYFEPEFIG